MSGPGSLIFDTPTIKGRSGGIDALRAIFALWVVIAHLVPRTYKLQGHDRIPEWLYYFTDTIVDRLTQASNELNPAVLGFIVLSGYCIHRNGLRSNDQGGAVTNFSIRRCFRILPVYWLACLLPLVMLPIALHFSEAKTIAVNGSATIDPMCLVAKMLTLPAITPSFHSDGCSSAGNGPLLTVTVEIWLYAIYGAAFALLAARQRDRAVLLIAIVSFTLSVVTAALANQYPTLYNWWQNSSVIGFLPYWWVGAALVIPDVQKWVQRRFLIVSACWIGLTAIILYGFEIGSAIAEVRKMFFVLGIGVIIGWLDAAQLGERNPLSALGRAGYSLYAFHSPILLPLVLAGVWWPLTLGVIIAFGLLAYYVVERPMIALGKRFLSRKAPNLRTA